MVDDDDGRDDTWHIWVPILVIFFWVIFRVCIRRRRFALSRQRRMMARDMRRPLMQPGMGGEFMQVVIPAGAIPGAQIQVQSPMGQPVMVAVPPGAMPGSVIQVRVPPAVTAMPVSAAPYAPVPPPMAEPPMATAIHPDDAVLGSGMPTAPMVPTAATVHE